MRFYTQTHQHYCGIDLHARCLYVCILDQQGNILVHRNIKAYPQALMQLITPYLKDMVIGVECMFSWYWLADLCRDKQIEFILGHALYMKAIHGHRHNTNFRPSSTRANTLPGNIFTRSVKIDLSTVITCEMFITDGLVRPESDLEIRIFPGALANERFEVMADTKTVEILLRLNEFA